MKWLRSEQVMLTAVFCLAELLWFLLGMRFDHADGASSPLYTYVQYVEPVLLRDRFFETLWYLHVQPPLFHVFLGAVLQFPERWHLFLFSSAYSAMALGLVLCSRALLADFGVGRGMRLIACAFLIVSPPLVLLAKWFYVQMPVAALLVAAALMLHRAIRSGKTRYLAGYGATISAIGLITAYFHLVWLLAMLGLGALGAVLGAKNGNGSLATLPCHRWRYIAAMSLPALLVLGVYAKNWMLFDFFAASTWSSVAPSRTARASVGPEVIEQWIAEGRISPLMRQDLQEKPVERIVQLSGTSPPAATGIAVLDQAHRSSGRTNWNYAGLLPVYRRLARDTHALAMHYPGAWLRHAMDSLRNYQAPATWSQYSVGRNRAKIRAWSKAFETVVWGTGLAAVLSRLFGRFAWVNLTTLLIPLLLAHAAWMWLRPRRAGPAGQADRVTIAFLAANIVYVAAVAIGVADAEHERYHFFSDALVYLLACQACAVWFGRWATVALCVPIALCVVVAAAPWVSSILG